MLNGVIRIILSFYGLEAGVTGAVVCGFPVIELQAAVVYILAGDAMIGSDL